MALVRAARAPDVFQVYRGTSLIRNRTPLGPYRRLVPRILGGGLEGYAYGPRGVLEGALDVFQVDLGDRLEIGMI